MTLAIRALQEDRFQQLRISDLHTAQGATLEGETLTPLVLNLETTPNSTLPIPEWELPMGVGGGMEEIGGESCSKSHMGFESHISFSQTLPWVRSGHTHGPLLISSL